MNSLDSYKQFKSIDRGDMLGAIQELPTQLNDAYFLGKDFPLPMNKKFDRIIIAGMGGSAIGADLLVAYAFPDLQTPTFILRDYQLPGWAAGKNCLVICSSHSGNTEETNSVLLQAIERNCTVVVITTGGKLLSTASDNGIVAWKFEHAGQPRAAVGFSFGLLLRLFTRLTIISTQDEAIEAAVGTMNELKKEIDANVPVINNPAKRIAEQLADFHASIFGAEYLRPVARRWKTQINELAKCWAQYEFMPEADHNTLAGVLQPADILPKVFTVFLESNHYHPRNKKRMDLTLSEFAAAGLSAEQIDFSADDRLAEMWKAILFGDYVSYYLAMMYEIDPTPVEAIESLKKQMQ
ncbi:MAG: bifunctional phosphoglucose/phosphomannose isomerase [Anaerolineaceae bacterium]|nr:bifunctional phosphoglucose/phosphomannose isomerase [Anaerolineaceae bacterium]